LTRNDATNPAGARVGPERSDTILLGRITGAHGIRGEVVIHSFAQRPEDIAAYGPLSDRAATRSFRLRVQRLTPKGAVIARVDGVVDRNAAEALKGVELYVARDRLPAPAEGEFYHADLIGLAAVAPDGAPLGEVVAVQSYGAGDLLEIRIPGRKDTELIPFTNAFVPTVDIAAGRAVVILPPVAEDD
jgi:16S rRNA processing protein RimM